MIISEKLMTEILVTIKQVTDIEQFDKEHIKWHGITYGGSHTRGIMDVYTIANMCKEWASLKSYYISSCLNSDHTIDPVCDKWSAWVNQLVMGDTGPQEIAVGSFGAGMEPEVIFKACEAILKNKI